ncbi:glycosyltransferase [Arthrobacter sp. A2-55]|uniref:glycosyltransferase n=1 Tax=Arthrobacter sp. A2-55 TaxID=2897337 RepID=UPI0021CD9073|nr:glycosyltransferase [Arthrobacter sp. A2-55]MCU6479910.1 glycosyltransferase [Arthrobacter sp. A2-55]
MKILHVVTLVTPDGAFGGPVRVALNQSKELIARGHHVTVMGGAIGYEGGLPTELDGVPVKLFRVHSWVPGAGFSGLASLGMIWWLIRKLGSFDVVHLHLARDLVTSPASFIAMVYRKEFFIQCHGMIDFSTKFMARLLDRLVIRRALGQAKTVFSLTPEEVANIRGLSQDADVEILLNGISTSLDFFSTTPRQQSIPFEVIMLGRVHSIKRPLVFVELAHHLAESFPNVRFTLLGPDGGEGSRVLTRIRDLGLEETVRWEGALAPSDVLNRIRHASIFVLPSESEVMPMSALESMSVGVPVVLCRPCGIADDVVEAQAGLVADQTLGSLVDVVSTLLVDPDLRSRMGHAGRNLVASKFSIERVVDQLESSYCQKTFGHG